MIITLIMICITVIKTQTLHFRNKNIFYFLHIVLKIFVILETIQSLVNKTKAVVVL